MPARLELIRPKRPFLVGMKRFDIEVGAAQQAAAEEALRRYERITSDWKTKVTFHIRKLKGGVAVGTRNKVFNFVDKGTKPHIIRPKRSRVLRFQASYKAKTRPGSLTSGGGGATGSTVFTARPVQHPGTQAREFTPRIAAEMRKVYSREMRKAISRLVGR